MLSFRSIRVSAMPRQQDCAPIPNEVTSIVLQTGFRTDTSSTSRAGRLSSLGSYIKRHACGHPDTDYSIWRGQR